MYEKDIIMVFIPLICQVIEAKCEDDTQILRQSGILLAAVNSGEYLLFLMDQPFVLVAVSTTTLL
ncbi:hypothetical protein DPMN_081094 [Dreissena polymorpha]|uniref:Uncharacterized protein n=1 Tax=Dreissena polymorpha TaxID=45954 RepID=A0A9D4BFM2_DREPO|nr:hypothetical protein DPMN_081094 [Dreissena polymorpha]